MCVFSSCSFSKSFSITSSHVLQRIHFKNTWQWWGDSLFQDWLHYIPAWGNGADHQKGNTWDATAHVQILPTAKVLFWCHLSHGITSTSIYAFTCELYMNQVCRECIEWYFVQSFTEGAENITEAGTLLLLPWWCYSVIWFPHDYWFAILRITVSTDGYSSDGCVELQGQRNRPFDEACESMAD
jgi:hypothetical protein